MRPGPPPKPTKLKVLEGNPGRRQLPANEPMPPPRTRVPAPPGNIGRHGKREWRRVAKVLFAQGLLTDLDMTAYRAYCHAYHRWYEAESAIIKSGSVVLTGVIRATTAPKPSPAAQDDISRTRRRR